MTKKLMTSLAEIKSFNPCASGWNAILRGRNKRIEDEELFPLSECLNSNTFANICWLLGKRKAEIPIVVNAAKLCAQSVAHLCNRWARNAAAAAAAADAAYATAAAIYAADAAAYAADAAADAAAADAAADAADAADAAADAADAAAYATATAAAAAYAAAADAAAVQQRKKNKQFLLKAIQDYEADMHH